MPTEKLTLCRARRASGSLAALLLLAAIGGGAAGCKTTSPTMRIFPAAMPRVPHRAMRTRVKGKDCGGYWH